MGDEKGNPSGTSGLPSPYFGLLQLAGLGSIAVACLYVLGFLVHLGHVYMLGFRPWPLSSLDDLLLAGQFLFQCLQSVTRALMAPRGLSWVGGHSLGGYFCWTIALISIDLLLGLRAVIKWLEISAWRRRLNTTLHVMKGLAIAILAGFWIGLLTMPFVFHDLLFPLSSFTHERSLQRFSAGVASFDSLPGVSDSERQANRRALLRSALSEEFSAAKRLGDTSLEERLSAFAAWRHQNASERESTFGFLLLISIILVVLLVRCYRQLTIVTSAGTWVFIVRKSGLYAWRMFMIVTIGFQVVTLPFDFGILMIERPAPRVAVRVAGLDEFSHEEFLLLGENDYMTYLYSPLAFWTLYAVPKRSIQEMRISGKTPVLSWMDDVVPED